jgi:hypothetical protein
MGRQRASRVKQPERQRGAAPAPAVPAAAPVQASRIAAPAAARPSPSLQRAARLGHRVVQTKLSLGPADDAYERQADATARQVMQWMGSPAAAEPAAAEPGGAAGGRTAQRALPDLGEADEDLASAKRLQRAPAPLPEEPEEDVFAKSTDAGAAGGAISGDVERSIDGARSGGTALDAGVRSTMEPAFGADFGGVRVHTGGEAHSLNESLQARAFTTGPDIFFRRGEYQPESSGGQELLAHELTHVVQQGAAQTQRVRRMPEDELEET